MSPPRLHLNLKTKQSVKLPSEATRLLRFRPGLRVQHMAFTNVSMLLSQTKQINKPLNCWRQKAKFSDLELNFTAQKRSVTF